MSLGIILNDMNFQYNRIQCTGKWVKRNNSTVTKQMRIMFMVHVASTIEKKKNKMGKTKKGSVSICLAG